MVKEQLEQEMRELLPEEYKFIFLADPQTIFGNEIGPGSPAERYFSSEEHKMLIRLFIITPPEKGLEEGLAEEKLYPILAEFYKENQGNMRLKFYYGQTATINGYKTINSDGNLIKEELFHDDDRLFNAFSYGENKNG